eukprot:850546-Rhodomonas_salina.1
MDQTVDQLHAHSSTRLGLYRTSRSTRLRQYHRDQYQSLHATDQSVDSVWRYGVCSVDSGLVQGSELRVKGHGSRVTGQGSRVKGQ